MSVFGGLKQITLKYASLYARIGNKLHCKKCNCTRGQFLPVIIRRNVHLAPKSAPWNVLFFGTDEFALESLRKLYTEYRLKRLLCRLEVVTAYKGRENALTRFTTEHGIPVHGWPLKINIAEFHIGLVVSFGHMIPESVIHSFPLGMLNVHASLLPRWRGAAPIVYTIMNGDAYTGVTIMKIMPKKFDVGEIVAQQKIDIHPDETMPQLHTKLARMGADLLLNTVEKLPRVLAFAKPQGDEDITYAPKVTSKLSLVKWGVMTAQNVYNLQRALHGLYPLTTNYLGSTIKLFEINILASPPQRKNPPPKIPGLVEYDKKSNTLVIQCREASWVSVGKVGIIGRPPMSACDFNNGYIAKDHKTHCFFQC